MTELNREPVLRIVPGPTDINANGHIFGGWVAIEAMKFITPIHIRDIISVYAGVERVGRTSMAVRIEVVATRDRGKTDIKVTEGLFTFVALDSNNRPRPVDTIA